MGRPCKSMQTLEMQGTRRKDRHGTMNTLAENPGVKVSLKCPKNLPELAKIEWKRVVFLLQERGILSHLDAAAIQDYALCAARVQECEADITAQGLMVDSLPNQHIQVAQKYRASMKAWADVLGLSPLQRGKLSIPADRGHVSKFNGVK